MLDIILRVSAGNAVAVVSTEHGDEDYLYRAKFLPGAWRGFFEAYRQPVEDGAIPVWEAGSILQERDPDTRLIYTGLGNSQYTFEPDRAATLRAALQVPGESDAIDVINWIRGEDVEGYRDRSGWILGDIVHSKPVLVGAPSNFSVDEDYQSFMTYYADRPRMAYVGANDGMLHAFYGDTGEEAWAFIPQFALVNLKEIASSSYCHRYTCDLTPAVRDVKVDGIWRTVLVVGGREGGYGYCALDVTEPTSPALLWQVWLPNMKTHASEPEFAVIEDTPVVLIGSGLDTATGSAFLYAYDLGTGQLLGSRQLSQQAGARNKATKPRSVDLNLDGETDVVYVADLLGNVWRAEVNGSQQPNSWNFSALYSGDQPITATPVPAYGEAGKILVYFGTGAYLETDDLLNTDQNSFYCVYDGHDGNSHNRFDLANQTGDPGDIGDANGWFVDLWHQTGERVTQEAVVVAGAVYFTAFAPTNDVCEAGGHSWLYQMAYNDGSALQDEDGETDPRDVDIGEGIASQPVADIVNEQVVVQASDAEIITQEIGPTIFRLTVRSWQESYDFVEESTDESGNVNIQNP
jgi:type IV pilus assembly protein PilY1